MHQDICVILKAHLLRLARAKVFDIVLWRDRDESDGREDRGDDPQSQRHLPEQADRFQLAIFGHQGQGDPHLAQSEHGGRTDAIHHPEDRALLGIVGQTALTGLGDDALAGIAQIKDGVHDKEPDQSEALRQIGRQVIHQECRNKHGDVADHHERAVLAELPVSAVHDQPHKGVGDAVPDAGDHAEGTSQDNTGAHKSGQVVSDIPCHEQVTVGRRVVE